MQNNHTEYVCMFSRSEHTEYVLAEQAFTFGKCTQMSTFIYININNIFYFILYIIYYFIIILYYWYY